MKKLKTQKFTYKALMVRDKTHREIVVQAKKRDMTIDEFISLIYKKTVFLKK